jgi:glycosyltransferase A (GT-A) superfamily protein (DUF2064 family)
VSRLVGGHARAGAVRALVRSRRVLPQRGRDLGAHGSREPRGGGERRPVIALGADAPHVARRALGAAARALDAGADVVLGPARDGGYY